MTVPFAGVLTSVSMLLFEGETRMPKRIGKSSRSTREHYRGKHRFEHWYVDNQVYFITARCRGRFSAFASEEAKSAFWDRFDHHTKTCLFTPWVTSLLGNHYHALGYCKTGRMLGEMMRRAPCALGRDFRMKYRGSA